jgi:hypothetical protein
MRYWIPIVLLLLVLAVGCVQRTGDDRNETMEYYNESGNETIPIPKGNFAFKIHGEDEFWLPPNKSIKFYVVFNNVDDDEEKHKFIARAHPSAANFDVMAAYKCSHFTTCDSLLEDMENFINQPKTPIWVNYTFVGLYTIDISIPENAVNGTYMYNMVACQDMGFDDCTETQTNWGPNIPIIVHVI